MQQLIEQLAKVQLEEMTNNGEIKNLIHEHTKKALEDSIEDAVKWSSEFRKELNKKVEESLNIAIRHVTLPEYNQLIKSAIEQHYTDKIKKSAITELQEVIEKAIKPVKKETTFSELQNQIEDIYKKDEHDACYFDGVVEEIEIETQVEKDHIKLKLTGTDDDQTIVDFYRNKENNTWRVGYIKQKDLINRNGVKISGHPANKHQTYTNPFTGLMYQYYATQAEFSGDPDSLCSFDVSEI